MVRTIKTMTRLSELSLILVAVTSMLTSGVTGQCIKDLQTIVDMEEAATDYSQERTYTLCPRTIFEMGTLNHNYDLQGFNVDPPIPIRPNLHVKCGDDGSKENLCWIATGDLHLDGTSVRGITETSIENVVIEGIVFIGAQKYSVWANKPGDITFKNCEWRVRFCKYLLLYGFRRRNTCYANPESVMLFHVSQSTLLVPHFFLQDHTKAVAPILLDYFDGSDSALTVTFEECIFLVSSLHFVYTIFVYRSNWE